jgi:hypothetical protein
MKRTVVAFALLLAMLSVWAVPSANAQTAPNPKDPPSLGNAVAGMYTQAARPTLAGAFDRAISELDAAPQDASPRAVKDLSFRRRLLELRLLMDVNAFAYDKDRMKSYREVVDQTYESIGNYQDLADIEKELGVPVNPDVVASRRNEMNGALAGLRDANIRNQMRAFFAAPLGAPRKGGGPGLWDITGSAPSNSFDAVGNAAELQSGIIRFLQASDLGVNDIFDPDQAIHFHLIRKEMRNVVILSAMFPDTSDVTRDAIKPLDDLVDDYGDTLEAHTAYEYAKQAGMDTAKVEAELRREFERALTMKGQFVDAHSLDAVAIALNGVRDSHRR